MKKILLRSMSLPSGMRWGRTRLRWKFPLLPVGATFTEESTAIDESSVKGQSRNAPPSKKSKKGNPWN
jgi:hypothetical protein